MRVRLAAIADDYTGASDLANTWRRCGLNTVQTIGVPTSLEIGDADAVVVAHKIRSVPAESAVRTALEAYDWLAALGVEHVMYKVCSTFDSTDRGNIGPVADALRERGGAPWLLVTPAFPETRRTVYKGHLFVGDVLLSDSPLRHHPLNPMRDANLVRVLGRQSADGVGLLDLAAVRGGVDAALGRIDAMVGAGDRSIVADALEERDLETLGEVAVRVRVSVGASGLGLGLARAIRHAGPGPGVADGGRERIGGLAAVISGSCSARTLEQITAAEGTLPVLRLDPEALVSTNGDVSHAATWARERIADGPVVIAASADPETVRKVQERHGPERTGHIIEGAMADLASRLVDMGVRRLVVAGGETSGAVVDHLGVRGFRIGDEIAPGVPVVTTIGRSGGELSMALKSGNFGEIDFFSRALSML